jgi:hypothetical protein
VGLLLCSDKDQTKVEYAIGGLDQQVFVSRYLVALPAFMRLLAAAGYDVKVVKAGHVRTLKDILAAA